MSAYCLDSETDDGKSAKQTDSPCGRFCGKIKYMDWSMWAKNHWRKIAGYSVFLSAGLQAGFQAIKFILSLGGDIDFIVSRSEDPGWVGTVINFVLDPHPVLIVALFFAGVGLILWDNRRNKKEPEKIREVLEILIPESMALARTQAADVPSDKVRNLLDAELSEPTIAAYIRSSDLVRNLDKQIARYGDKQPSKSGEPPITHVFLEEAQAFGFKSIRDLDSALRNNGNAAVRMSQYSMVTGEVMLPGYCLTYMFMVLGCKLGYEKWYELIKDYQFARATKEGLKHKEEFYWSAVSVEPKA